MSVSVSVMTKCEWIFMASGDSLDYWPEKGWLNFSICEFSIRFFRDSRAIN